MTPVFAFEIIQFFYDTFNARAVRRHIAALYSANALAFQLRQARGERQRTLA